MDVSGWLHAANQSRQPELFAARKPQGATKRLVGRLLATANAHAAHFGSVRDEFYGLKRLILEQYGQPDGVDWQRIVKRCYGCEACGDSWHDAKCDGTGVWERKWIPLTRTRLGGQVFHTPGNAQWTDPGVPVTFTGLVRHRAVREDDANAAFCTLALWFDRELFRKIAGRLFAPKPDEMPF